MKYMGSKRRLSKDLVPLINGLIKENNIQNYVEPFVGGFNVIDKVICDNKIANDYNVYVTALFEGLLKGRKLPDSIEKEFYYDVKENKEKYDNFIVGYVGFLSSFRGKFFGGYAGKTKEKTGKVRDYYDESKRNIEKQIKILNNVKITNESYENICVPENSLVYCDPPYEGTTEYKNADKFNSSLFWEWVRKESKRNIVLVSEYKAPEDFKCIYEKELKTTLATGSSKKVIEKLFVIKGDK